MKGNKGEWSELYVLLRLLAYGRLFAADENVKRIDDTYFPILKIIRNESSNKLIEYLLKEGGDVEVILNNELRRTLTKERLKKQADLLYKAIKNGSNRSFDIPESNEIISELECGRLAAPATDKTDISMQIYDIHTGISPVCGFSIKSELGNAPTLLNASKSTNFIYRIDGIDEETMEEINNIDSKNKIKDRIAEVIEKGKMIFEKALNDTFAANLMLIDSRMEELVGHILLYHYKTGENNCKKIIQAIESANPMNFPRPGFYEYKFKKLLCSVALGMVPAKDWNGQDDANGGYIIVADDGDVVAYHLYNRNYFEDYLLNHTKFERGSTSRHDYASIYRKDGKMYMNLNLQIRFM